MARNKRPPKSLPSGVITAMFTDIVNSTKLKGAMEGDTAARRDAKFRSDVKEPHDKIVLTCMEDAGGHKVKSTGDGYLFMFTDAEEAVLCALRIQDQLRANPINTPLGPLQVRIGLHTGIASPTGGDYIASAMDKAARVESKAEPGQVFVSRETYTLVIGKLRGVDFEKAGTFELKGLESENLYRAFQTGVRTSGADTPRISPHSVSLAQLQNPTHLPAHHPGPAGRLPAPPILDTRGRMRPGLALGRVMTTVLFVDIAGATERLVALGDRRWLELQAQYTALVRQELARHGGEEIDVVGARILAVFDGAAAAIRCGCAIRDAVQGLGIMVKVGIHAGEVEYDGRTIGGITVHTGSRITGAAQPGEVLVSHTVKDLVAGSGITFTDRGTHLLRGLPGEWRLFTPDVPETSAPTS
jgi:class 3 adenylate cyclase